MMPPTQVKLDKRIFVSYERGDRDFAVRLVVNLRKAGADIWIDDSDIPAGVDWTLVVQGAIETCSQFLVILSPTSVASEEVKREVDFALELGKPVVPVLYKKCDLRRLYRIGSVHKVDFTGEYAIGFSKLLRALGMEPSGVSVPKLAAQGRGPLYGALLGGFVLGIAIGALYGSVGRRQSPPVAVKVNPIDNLGYVWVPPGSFMMGCSAQEQYCGFPEAPYSVRLRGFRIGETEVTQAAYMHVTAAPNPSSFVGDANPVEQVTWYDARRYCRAVAGRLPTNEEWEYAARAGASGPPYPDKDNVGWHNGNSNGRTHPVRLKSANAWGLYDMFGNVSEWTQDAYANKDKPSGEALFMVIRGGGWNDPEPIWPMYQARIMPSANPSYIGFRCAWDEL